MIAAAAFVCCGRGCVRCVIHRRRTAATSSPRFFFLVLETGRKRTEEQKKKRKKKQSRCSRRRRWHSEPNADATPRLVAGEPFARVGIRYIAVVKKPDPYATRHLYLVAREHPDLDAGDRELGDRRGHVVLQLVLDRGRADDDEVALDARGRRRHRARAADRRRLGRLPLRRPARVLVARKVALREHERAQPVTRERVEVRLERGRGTRQEMARL